MPYYTMKSSYDETRETQLLFLYSAIAIVATYYVIFGIFPYLYQRVLASAASSNTLDKLQMTKHCDDKYLKAELERLKMRPERYELKKLKDSARLVQLIPPEVNAFAETEKVKQCGQSALRPAPARASVRYQLAAADVCPLDGSLNSSRLPTTKKTTDFAAPISESHYHGSIRADGPMSTLSSTSVDKRAHLIAEQDLAYEISVESDLKKQCELQNFSESSNTRDADADTSIVTEKEPEGGVGVVDIIFNFHRYQKAVDDFYKSDAALPDAMESASGPLRIRRKFNTSSSIGSLLSFIQSCSCCPLTYDVYTSFPKRHLTSRDSAQLLFEWGITSNCIINVQETS